MKTEVIKDLPLGILLIVISQFFLLGAHQIINIPYSWYTLPTVVLCSILYWKFFRTGWVVSFVGIEVEVEESE